MVPAETNNSNPMAIVTTMRLSSVLVSSLFMVRYRPGLQNVRTASSVSIHFASSVIGFGVARHLQIANPAERRTGLRVPLMSMAPSQ